MTQIMVEVGCSSLGPVRRAIELALTDVGHKIEVLSTEATASLEYASVNVDLDAACSALQSGELSSIRLRSDGADVAWVLLFGPTFGSGRAEVWTAAIELRHHKYRPLFERLLKQDDLSVVIVSMEETLDLSPTTIGPSTFPWNDWRLIVAAVRDDAKHWHIGPGPAARRSSNLSRGV